jgi:acyl-homoserine lactone acylase PvdQ
MHLLRLGLALTALTLVLTFGPGSGTDTTAQTVDGRYQGFGDPGGFLNILPPGQDGQLNGLEAILAQGGQMPPHFQDQLAMYGDLVYNTPGLTEAQLTDFFKDASFGVKPGDIDRVYSPTPGVTVIRDKSFGVPHIFGETRYATMFAQGYTGAEDRMFLMDALRHVGRGRASEFLGAAPSNLALDRDQVSLAPYKEEDLTRQLNEAIAASGTEGELIYHDLLAYVDGVNKYIGEMLLDPTKLPAEYPALQVLPQPWKPEDTVAIASLVGGIFGKGGGAEVRNYCGLQQLTANVGNATTARQIFNDMHFANDPEAPTTASGNFPYMMNLGPVNAAAVPSINCSSLTPVDDYATSVDDVFSAIADGTGAITLEAPWGPIPLNFNDAMSNAVLIGANKTTAGHPIAVFGPQTSYYVPQLLVEKDVHGPGIDARGASFAGTDLYVQLGRGRDYAWSATSAGGDNIDQFVLRLCEPGGGDATTDSMGYLRDGVCEPIETYQHTQIAKPSAGGIPEGPDVVLSWRIERTQHYGPVSARGTLNDGTPIAIATLRTTYNNELGSSRGFSRINNPDFMVDGYDSFRQAMGTGVDYTFNWFYIDVNDIGYQHSCRCPQRAQGVDPYLPAWGDGRFDWTGFIGLSQQPWQKNPPSGYLTSWNNKQAPGFMANDANYSYGPTYRDDLLTYQIQKKLAQGKVDRADVVDIMEEAGTVDLRGQEVLPYLLQLMGTTAPAGIDPRAQGMRDTLAAWLAADSHRRDHDRDGAYDDPHSPAIMDAWWGRLTHAIFDPAGNPIDALHVTLDDANRIHHIGSAFQDGTYGQVQKDIRRVLGLPVQGAFSRKYCGGGNVATCRALVWQSLAMAAADLEVEFGSADPGAWQRQVADEDVQHSAVGVTQVPAIHWINRPTFQQVVQIVGPTSAGRAFGAGWLTAPDGKAIGFAFDVSAFTNGTGSGRLALRDYSTNKVIDMRNVTLVDAPATGSCGTIAADAANSFVFEGTGTYSGTQRNFRVCVQDNGDPGAGVDRLHVECVLCPYNTGIGYTSEVLASGNIKVNVAPLPDTTGTTGAPSVIVLDPILGGLPVLTATVLDAAGSPVGGVPVKLSGVTVLPLTGITNSLGQAVFAVVPSSSLAKASVGNLQSNPVSLLP